MATAIAVKSAAAATEAAEAANTAKLISWHAADFAISNLGNRQVGKAAAAAYATKCGIYEYAAVAYAVELAEKAEFDAKIAHYAVAVAVAAAAKWE
jgi:hypothetical protein